MSKLLKCDQCGDDFNERNGVWRFKDKKFCHQVCLIKNMADWGEEDIEYYVAWILMNISVNKNELMEKLIRQFSLKLNHAFIQVNMEWPDED